jgi:hypothetical protein
MPLGPGSTITVIQANRDFFLSLSQEFGNSNPYISLMKHFDSDFLLSQIEDSTTLGLFSDDPLPASVLFHILSHDLLKISTEDPLFSSISSPICSDPDYFDLLQFVRFEYLSADSVPHFLSARPNWIAHRLWESISRRFILPAPAVSHSKCLTEVEFPLQEAESPEGIIS